MTNKSQFTNSFGVSDILVEMIREHEINRRVLEKNVLDENADFMVSVTELLQPARIFALKRKQTSEVTEDMVDMLVKLDSSLLHERLSKLSAYITENTLSTLIPVAGAQAQLIGTYDMYDPKKEMLIDFKKKSLFYFIDTKDSVIDDWTFQLNAYAYLHNLHYPTLPVKRLQIIGIAKDWTRTRAYTGVNLLPMTYEYDIEVWSYEKTEQIVKDRIKTMLSALHTLPQCSDRERWVRNKSFAVIRKGRKRATALYSDLLPAQKLAKEKGADYSVESRPKQYYRCMTCQVRNICKQYIEDPGAPVFKMEE